MGHERKRLPRGVDTLAEVIGERAALELVLWRWARSCERRMAALPRAIDDPHARRRAAPGALPTEVAIFVPREPLHDLLLPDAAAELAAALGGETIVARVPDWLLTHYLNRAGLRDLCAGVSAVEVSRRYGRTPSVWRKLFSAPARPSPLDDVDENIAGEVVRLLVIRRPLTDARKSGM